MIYVSFAKKPPTVEEFQQYLDELYLTHEQNPGFPQIFDGSNGIWLPSEIQLMQARWLKDNTNFLEKNSPLAVFVVPNRISKLVLSGIFLIQKSPVPYVVTTSEVDARMVLHERMAQILEKKQLA